MAVPRDPQDPNANRVNNNVDNRRPVHTTGASWFGWWWIWVVIIITAFWFAGWGWGGYGGWWWGGRRPGIVGRVTNPGNPAYYNGPTTGTNNPSTARTQPNGAMGANGQVTGPGLEVLESTNKTAYVGKNFQIDNVPVQGKVSDHAVWIGTNHAARMLVVSNGNVDAALANSNEPKYNRNNGMGASNLVDVNGTVTKAPTEAQAKKEWGLSNDAAKQLEHQDVYVMASQVQSAQLANPNPSVNGNANNTTSEAH